MKLPPELERWDARPGQPTQVEQGVVRVLQDNPGPFTGPGTNTFLLGTDELWILDPGEDEPSHLDALLAAVDGRPVRGILVSHGHEDHWPLAPALATATGAQIWAFAALGELEPNRRLVHGEHVEVDLDGAAARLRFLHTPGHCSDHVSFVLDGPGDAPLVLCADHVMAWSTTILSPRDGDLDAYLGSLDLLIDLQPRRMLPAHGPEIADPVGRMVELRDHRLERSAQLLAALESGPGTLDDVVPVVYADTDPAMHGAAKASLHAHVESLLRQGLLTRSESGTLQRSGS